MDNRAIFLSPTFSSSIPDQDFENFETLSRYTELLPTLAARIQTVYPGFRMRIYHNLTADQPSQSFDALCDLYCQYPHVDLCDVRDLPGIVPLPDRVKRKGEYGLLFN